MGDRNTPSSSGLDSSLRGDTALSLGVESVDRNQSTSEYTADTVCSSPPMFLTCDPSKRTDDKLLIILIVEVHYSFN